VVVNVEVARRVLTQVQAPSLERRHTAGLPLTTSLRFTETMSNLESELVHYSPRHCLIIVRDSISAKGTLLRTRLMKP
jgi:hypothetical protein